jgi:hypothetical protein
LAIIVRQIESFEAGTGIGLISAWGFKRVRPGRLDLLLATENAISVALRSVCIAEE